MKRALTTGRFTTITLLGLLVVATGAQLILTKTQVAKSPTVSGQPIRIKGFLETAEGWAVHDLPLSSDPIEERRTYELLNFDEVLYKEFSNGDAKFSLFIAHWKNTTMAAHEIASHTPDKCWTLRAWTCSRYMRVAGGEVGLDGMPPGYWREFRDPNNQEVFVMYWHLVDGQVQDYGGNRLNFAPGVRYWLRSAFDNIAKGRCEQYFVRVTSNQSFDTLRQRAELKSITRELERIGLRSSGG